MRNLVICFTLAAFCSCTVKRRIYSSTQINIPSLQKKNDHSFSVTYSDPPGFDFTGCYAITNRLAIIGGAHIYANKDEQKQVYLLSGATGTATLFYHHKGFHAGFGTYIPLSKKNGGTFLSFFNGYIKGNFRMDENFYENSNSTPPSASTLTRVSFYKSNIGRYFLQGSINGCSKILEATLTCRYNYVVYSNITTDYDTNEQLNSNLPPLGYSRFSQFLDFGFDSKLFFTKNRRIGLQFFGSVTTRLNKKEFNFYYYNTRLGIGLVVKNPFTKK